MSHVDYVGWARFALEMLLGHGLSLPGGGKPVLLLETACGTGTVAGLLALQGYDVDAFDASPAMIDVARIKARIFSRKPGFFVADFLSLDASERYDAVLCLYDSMNYLKRLKELVDFMGRVRRALKPDGLFLFDVCTEFNSRVNFSNRKEDEKGSGYHYIREMRFYPKEMIQENRFKIMLDSRPGMTIYERHQQRIYSLGAVRRALAKAHLQLLEETEGFDRRPPGPEALRVHFICKKPK